MLRQVLLYGVSYWDRKTLFLLESMAECDQIEQVVLLAVTQQVGQQARVNVVTARYSPGNWKGVWDSDALDRDWHVGQIWPHIT